MITSLIICLLLYALYLKISYKKPNVYGISPSDDTLTNLARYNEVPERDYNVHTWYDAEYYSYGYHREWEFYPKITGSVFASYYEKTNQKLNVSGEVKNGENAIAVAQLIRMITLAYLAHTNYAGDRETRTYELATAYLKDKLDEKQYKACLKFYAELRESGMFTNLSIHK